MANIFLDKVSIGGNTYDIHDIAVRELLASEEKSSTAVAAHAAGRYLVYDDHLYTAKTDIAVGDTLVVGTNIELVPGGAINQIAELKSAIQNMGASATTLAEGSQATVDKQVDPQTGAVTLAFGIPKGDGGEDGVSPTISITDITGGHRVTITDATGPHSFDVMDGDTADAPVQDVQVNGVSVLQDGMANVPIADSSNLGVVKAGSSTMIYSSGSIEFRAVGAGEVKAGTTYLRALTPERQHASVFYGLAKAAGSDMASSSNPIGTYTDEAKVAIQKMLGIYEAPWELIREDTFTNETEADHWISVDSLGQAFELTDIVLLFETPQQDTYSAKGGYGGIGFRDGNSIIVATESNAWTQNAGTAGHGVTVVIEQNGCLLKATSSANTTDTNGGVVRWRYGAGLDSYVQNVRYIASPVNFSAINITKVTGTGHYILLGRRKWN